MNDKTYITSAKSITSRTNDELMDMAFSGQSLEAVMQEVWRRKNPNLMRTIALSEYVVSDPKHCKFLVKFVESVKDNSAKFDIIESILSHSPDVISKSFPSSLFITMARSSVDVAALIMISEGTPSDVITEISERNLLGITRSAIFIDEKFIGSAAVNQNKLLEAIITLLKNGYQLANKKTASILLSRLSYSSADQMATSIAKYPMSPSVAELVEQSVLRYGGFNALIKNNFKGNKSSGVRAFNLSKEIASIETNMESCVEDLLIILDENSYTGRIDNTVVSHFLSIIENKCLHNEQLFFNLLRLKKEGRNIFLEFAQKGRRYCTSIIMMIKQIIEDMGEKIYLQYMNDLDPIFDIALKEFNLHQVMASYPDAIKKYIPALNSVPVSTSKPKQEQPKEEQAKDMEQEDIDLGEDFMDDRPLHKITSNWYDLYKDAGLGDLAKGALATAVLTALFLGADKIDDIARKYKIPPEKLEMAVNNPQFVELVREQAGQTNQPSQVSQTNQQAQAEATFSGYIADLQRHEGLRLTRYRDTQGHPTIGWGHRIRPGENLTRITRQQADEMLRNDSRNAWNSAQQILAGTNAPPQVQRIVANMTFQMGENGVRGFRNMIAAIQEQDWHRAADEMLDSDWATQTPNRARELADRMRRVQRD